LKRKYVSLETRKKPHTDKESEELQHVHQGLRPARWRTS